MNRCLPLGFALLFLGALLRSPACSLAADDDPTAADRERIVKVSKRLLDVCDPVPGLAWPPQFILVDSTKTNAGAALEPGARPQPVVRVSSALMQKVVQGDLDRLALVLGHELSHILLRHVDRGPSGTDGTYDGFTRDQELKADRLAMELMLKASFSFRRGRKAFQRLKELGLDSSSFEGRCADQPSWDDRMGLIDDPNSTAWKSMSAYDSGLIFVGAEQYGCAELCFDRVTREFPNCYEAWANLGHACLMEYFDRLDSQDLQDYHIGQVVATCFYRRGSSISIRGNDPGPKLWPHAVGAFKEALRLKDDLTQVKADLGLAYLFHPDGEGTAEGTRWLQEAADAAVSDKTLDRAERAALLVNLGVAELAGGKSDKGLAHLDEGEKMGAPAGRENPALAAALLYNRAWQTANGKDQESREKAAKLFEEYLGKETPLSYWWPLAYERYASLCKVLGRPAKDKSAFEKGRREQLASLTGVRLKSGEEVTPGEEAEEVVKKLGVGRQIVAVGGANLKRVIYDKEGVMVLITDKVMAVCLIDAAAPQLSLKPSGPAVDKAATLHVGMTVEELQAAILWEPETVNLIDSEVRYRYYRDLGLVIRIEKGRVTALVVGPAPKTSE